MTAVGAGAGAVAGAVGLGLAAGVGGAVALGEYGIGKTRDAYGARRGRLIGMEGVARAGSAMGGGQNLGSAFESIGGMGGMSEYGMDSAQALSARGAFLAARGSSETFRGSRSMNAVMGRYQVDPGIAGSGASLGYSGDQMLSMSERLHNAGAVAGASMQELFAHEQRAAGYGILGSGVADKNTSFVNTLSRQGFGGGQFGAISAVQKLQGVGGGMADSIRGSMSQIGEALVLAKSVKNAGNLLGGIEGVDTMSAQEKFQAMQGSASVPALFGQRWSVAQASGRAGRATPDVDSPNFSGPRGEADAAHQSAMDQKAQVSKALLTLEKLDRTMEILNTTMVENIEFNKKYMGAKTYAAASLNNGFQ